jgi:hypothetical protein
MSNIVVKIQGLALCVPEEGNDWKVYFPKAEKHDFKIIVEKSVNSAKPEKTEYFMQTATVIDLFPNNTTSSIQKNSVENSLDICRLHDQDIFLKKLINDDFTSNYAGILSLRNCVLKTEDNQDKKIKIDIWEVRKPSVSPPTKENPPTKTWVAQTEVATEFNTEFIPAENSLVDIKIHNTFELSLDANLKIVPENNTDYIVTFYNDCGEEKHCGDGSDFKYYYNIINESEFKEKRRFEMTFVDENIGKRRTLGSPCGGITAPIGRVKIPG